MRPRAKLSVAAQRRLATETLHDYIFMIADQTGSVIPEHLSAPVSLAPTASTSVSIKASNSAGSMVRSRVWTLMLLSATTMSIGSGSTSHVA